MHFCGQSRAVGRQVTGPSSAMCPPALVGSLYPTSMRISGEGRLVVNFKTEAQFHGVFVLSHPGKQPRPR